MTAPDDTIDGPLDPRLGAIVPVLTQSLGRGDDLGFGLTVMEDGRVLADLRGGWRDRHKTVPFGDTLSCVYSSGKAVLAALLMRAVAEGALDYDAPVADAWSAFGAAGKDRVTVAEAMSHQAGVPGFPDEVDPALWLDWKACCAAIARLSPLWTPGTAHGYHPQTVGYIGGELLRRATGTGVGEQLRALGLDIHCGIAPGSAAAQRIGPMVKPSAPPDLGTIDAPTKAAFLERWSSPAGVSREDWLAAEIPASNCHATSTGLAQLMQAFATGEVDGKSFAGAPAREAAMAERTAGPDRILPFDLAWAAGPMRNRGGYLGPSPAAVGHYGFGGSFVLADPARRLSIAYVPNRMLPVLVGGPRATAILDTVYEALG